jgi:diacylglycerol kinase family enzyme
VQGALRQAGFAAEAVATRAAGDAEHRARECAGSGAAAIFALGGDGTLRECAAGVLGTEAGLGFLPAGTVNVMAGELGIHGSAVRAARAYAGARTIPFGVGLAGSAPFLMQVSAGIDAFLIRSLQAGEKKWLGRIAILPATLRALKNYTFPPFSVSSDSGAHTVTLAVASNIVRYGGPFRLTPQARSDGSSLELFLFSGRGRSAALHFALSLLLGRHLKLRSSRLVRVRRARLTACAGVPLQIDGDVLESVPDQPLEIGLAAETVRMLVPAASRLRDGRQRA